MAVELLRSLRTGRTYARFVIEGHWDDRDVSVVGPFNRWTPGIDVLRPDRNGARSALVEVAEGSDVHFRYLASGNDWFDDPEADEVTEHGSTVIWAETPPNGGTAAQRKPAPLKKAVAAKKPAPAKKAVAAKKPAPAKKAAPAKTSVAQPSAAKAG